MTKIKINNKKSFNRYTKISLQLNNQPKMKLFHMRKKKSPHMKRKKNKNLNKHIAITLDNYKGKKMIKKYNKDMTYWSQI